MTDPSPSSAVTRRRSTLGWLAIAVMALGVAGALIAAGVAASSGPAAPASAAAGEDYGTAPVYRLVDQNDHVVRSSQFIGKVQVVSFLFPYCTTYCPLLARDMARLASTLESGPLSGKVQLLSFNVDPKGAGPAVLRKFIAQYGGDPATSDWEYLTGSAAQIRQTVTGGFHVYFHKTSLAAENADISREKATGTYTPQPQQPNALARHAHVNYDIVHNDFVEIINSAGRIVALLDQASTLSQSQLLAAIRDAVDGRSIPAQRVP